MLKKVQGLLWLGLVALVSASPFSIKKSIEALNKAREGPLYYRDYVLKNYKERSNDGLSQSTSKPYCWLYLDGIRFKYNDRCNCKLIFGETDKYFQNRLGSQNQGAKPLLEADLGLSWQAYTHAKYLGSKLHYLSRVKEPTSGSSQNSSFPGNSSILYRHSLSSINETAFVSSIIIAFHEDILDGQNMSPESLFNKNLDILDHQNWTKCGVGLFNRPENSTSGTTVQDKYSYVVVLFAQNDSTGTDNSTLTCEQKKEMGWINFVKEQNISDSCVKRDNGTTNGTNGNTSNGTNNGSTNGTSSNGTTSNGTVSEKPPKKRYSILNYVEVIEEQAFKLFQTILFGSLSSVLFLFF